MSRRLVAALGAVVVAVVVVALAVSRLTGGPPDDTLAELVPPTALVYAHSSTDRSRGENARLVRTLEKLPGARRLRTAALRRVGGTSRGFSFERDIRPWLGDEAAFALLPSPRRATASRATSPLPWTLSQDSTVNAGSPRPRRRASQAPGLRTEKAGVRSAYPGFFVPLISS